MPDQPSSSFDPIAGLYHRLWADWYLPAALPALEKLLFSRIAPPAALLDVCCGSGHVTRELVRRQYRVSGIDASQALLAFARRELPSAEFHLQDVRSFKLRPRFDAALSTFDSLNHLLSLDDLGRAFACVRRALKPDGLFVFDMNLQEAFQIDPRTWSVDVGPDTTSLIRGSFDDRQQLARTQLIWFSSREEAAGNACWTRTESVIEERCYAPAEIRSELEKAGFRRPEWMTAEQAGMNPQLGYGRIFVTARA